MPTQPSRNLERLSAPEPQRLHDWIQYFFGRARLPRDARGSYANKQLDDYLKEAREIGANNITLPTEEDLCWAIGKAAMISAQKEEAIIGDGLAEQILFPRDVTAGARRGFELTGDPDTIFAKAA